MSDILICATNREIPLGVCEASLAARSRCRSSRLSGLGGRIDAAASTRSTPDVAAAILQAGLGRGYSGGRREGWCG